MAENGLRKGLRRFVVGLLVLVIVGVAGFLWVANWTYSDGTRAGYLVKVTRKGVVFKTYEGQLNLGGFQGADDQGLVGNTWEFSVKDEDVYRKLQGHEGQKVKLAYEQQYRAMPWQGKTNYFVTAIERIEE